MSEDYFFKKEIMGGLNDAKLTGLNIFGQHLILGELSGKISSHEISTKNKLIGCKDKSLGAKIDQILLLPNRSIAFVLVGGEIRALQIPKLDEKASFKIKEGIEKMYINKDSREYENSFLIITKKKKIKIIEFDPSTCTLVEKQRNKEISVEDFPRCGTWVGNKFIYSYSKVVSWLDLETGKPINVDFDGAIQLINFGTLIGIVSKEMTLFMQEGKAYSFNPILNDGVEFIQYVTYKNYLLGLYKDRVSILKKSEQKYDLFETLNFDKEGQGKCIITSYDKIIIATENPATNTCNILSLKERPYELQMEVLITQGQFNPALEMLIENVPETDTEKNLKIEKFFLDCAWCSLSDKNYDLALKYFSLSNFNPFELMYMFYNYLSVNIIHEDKKSEIISNREKNQLLGLSPEESELKQILSFLINVLIAKRDYIVEAYKSTEDKYKNITFLSSKFGKINLSESTTSITVSQTLDSINSVLIKSMIKLKKVPKEIMIVLDNKSINFSIFDELDNDQFFQDHKNRELNETKFTLAYIAEKKGEFEKALEAWKDFGTKKDDTKLSLFAFEGKDRTKKIFYKFKDTKSTDRIRKETLFTTYIKWLLKKHPNEAFDVAIKTELVGIKKFMDEIIPDVEKDNDSESGALKEKFLEYCNQNQQTENYQTQLLELYAEKMFSLKKKETEEREVVFDGELGKYHASFIQIIKDKNSCYNKKKILEVIEGSYLKEAILYLYSQLKEHDKALKELFRNARANNNFKQIEEYCLANLSSKKDIFQDFYKLLSDIINNECQKIIDKDLKEIETIEINLSKLSKNMITEGEKRDAEERKAYLRSEIARMESSKKPIEAEMLKILREYGSIENLDPLFALNYADEHWNVCGNNDFFNYLSNVIKEYTIEGNKYKIGKNLSEMGLIYKEKEALDYKKKFVTIDSEKTCDLCKKKIGNTIFVVYPNLKVYHVKCSGNPNIDPLTGVDFSKKKFI